MSDHKTFFFCFVLILNSSFLVGMTNNQLNISKEQFDFFTAAGNGDLTTVKNSIQSGCAYDFHYKGESPIIIASRNKHEDVTIELLRAGAQISCFSYIQIDGSLYQGVIKDIRKKIMSDVVILACSTGFQDYCATSKKDILAYLNTNDENTDDFFQSYSMFDALAVLKEYMLHATNYASSYLFNWHPAAEQKFLNRSDVIKRNMIIWASIFGDTAVVKKLLELNISPNTWDSESRRTALCYAARYGNSAIVNMLVQKGACISVPDDIGLVAYEHALQKGHVFLALYLVTKLKQNQNQWDRKNNVPCDTFCQLFDTDSLADVFLQKSM